MERTNPILLTLVILLVGSCTSQPPAITATHTPQLLHTSTPTSLPSETATSTYTPTLTPTITWTPLPTYPPSERMSIIMNLYENPTCRLPCWWGITPGETDWRDAWQFLARFASNQAPYDKLFFKSERLPDYQFFQVDLNVPKVPGQEFYSTLNNLVFFMHKGTSLIEYIDVNTGNVHPYTIPQILAVYGRPEQVYVHALVHPRPESNSIKLYLYYPEYGFMSVHFTTVDLDVWKNDEITACFQKYTRLLLWPKDEALDMEFVWALGLSDFPNSGRDPYQPIEEVTNIDTAKFFEAFAGNSEQVCLNILTANLEK